MKAEKTKRGGGDKREKILKAAVAVFANKGFHSSKISEIAQAAGVADGTIYLYFKHKDEILISVFEDSMDQYIGKFLGALKDFDDPVEKLKFFISNHINMAREFPDLASVLLIELRQSNRFIKEYKAPQFWTYLNILSVIIKEGQEKGVFRSDVSSTIAKRAIFGALDEVLLHYLITPNIRYTLDKAVDEISSIFLNGLLCCEPLKNPQKRRRP